MKAKDFVILSSNMHRAILFFLFIAICSAVTPPLCELYPSISLSAGEYVEGNLTPSQSKFCYNFIVPESMDEGVLKVVMNSTTYDEDVCLNVQNYNASTSITTEYESLCESANTPQVQLCNGGDGNRIVYQTNFYAAVWCINNCTTTFGIYWDYAQGPELTPDCSATVNTGPPVQANGGLSGVATACIIGAIIFLLAIIAGAAFFFIKRSRFTQYLPF